MKAVLFFLLMAAATALLVLGANLWAQTQAKIDAAEGLFVTLGTVEQLPDYEAPVKTKTLDSLWLGAEETEPVYGTVYDENVLDFPGAAYVHGPEKRTYYAALLPEEYTAPERQDTPPFNGSRCVIEFTPLESGRADRRQTVQVNRVLYGTYSGDEMKLCDMLSENTVNLEAGKTLSRVCHVKCGKLAIVSRGRHVFRAAEHHQYAAGGCRGEPAERRRNAADDYGGHAGVL